MYYNIEMSVCIFMTDNCLLFSPNIWLLCLENQIITPHTNKIPFAYLKVPEFCLFCFPSLFLIQGKPNVVYTL